MPRGDVVAIADREGNFTGKPRLAIIVQNDVFNELASATVCPLTSVAADAPLLRLELTRSETLPLDRTSWIEVDKIATVRRNRIGRTIGRLSAADLVRLNSALAMFFGLGLDDAFAAHRGDNGDADIDISAAPLRPKEIRIYLRAVPRKCSSQCVSDDWLHHPIKAQVRFDNSFQFLQIGKYSVGIVETWYNS